MVRWLLLTLLAACSNTPPSVRPPATTAIAPVATTTAAEPEIADRVPAPTPPPAMPALTRETFDEVVEDSFEAVFETCLANRPKTGDHSVEVTLVLRADRDPEIQAPVAWPVADPALEDCLVDQLVQLALPAFPITDELEFSYKIKERADGSRVRIFGTMVILPPTTAG